METPAQEDSKLYIGDNTHLYGIEIDQTAEPIEIARFIIQKIGSNKAAERLSWRVPLSRVISAMRFKDHEPTEAELADLESEIDALISDLYNNNSRLEEGSLPENEQIHWVKSAFEAIVNIRHSNDALIWKLREMISADEDGEPNGLEELDLAEAIVLYKGILKNILNMSEYEIDEIIMQVEVDYAAIPEQRTYFIKSGHDSGIVYSVRKNPKPGIHISTSYDLYVNVKAETPDQQVETVPIPLGAGVDIASSDDIINNLQNIFADDTANIPITDIISRYIFATKELEALLEYSNKADDIDKSKLQQVAYERLKEQLCSTLMNIAIIVYSNDDPKIHSKFNTLLYSTIDYLSQVQLERLEGIIGLSLLKNPAFAALVAVRETRDRNTQD